MINRFEGEKIKPYRVTLCIGVRFGLAIFGLLSTLLLYGCIGAQLTNETTVDFSSTAPFSCDQKPITVYGSQAGDPVTLGIPPELLKDKAVPGWHSFPIKIP
jgi:hypothetical protein